MMLSWPSSSLYDTLRKKQDNEINFLSYREEVEIYEEEYEENLDELGENDENDNEPEPPAKSQKPSDENNNRFSSMTKSARSKIFVTQKWMRCWQLM